MSRRNSLEGKAERRALRVGRVGPQSSEGSVSDSPVLVFTVEVRDRGDKWLVSGGHEAFVEGVPSGVLDLVAEYVCEYLDRCLYEA